MTRRKADGLTFETTLAEEGAVEVTVSELLESFSKWEREDIYPPLGPVNIDFMIEELEGAGYIDLHDGRAYLKP